MNTKHITQVWLITMVMIAITTATSYASYYYVDSWADLQNMQNDPTGHYYLSANLSKTTSDYHAYNDGAGFDPVGAYYMEGNPFRGTFDGQGHTISNLIINRSAENYIGLFGYTQGATIQNIGLIDIDIIGNYDVGGLVGNANYAPWESIGPTSIINSYVTGNVIGSLQVGGLAGEIYVGSSISDSYAVVNVIGSSVVGGLVGYAGGSSISNSYATGSVEGGSYPGGLVGYDGGGSDFTGSFWNTETTGQGTSAGGTGVNSTQMMGSSIYESAGWDLTNMWQAQAGGPPTLRGLEGQGGGGGVPEPATVVGVLAAMAMAGYRRLRRR